MFHLLSGVLAFVVLLPQFPVVYNFVVWFVAHGLYELKDVADPQTTNSPANSFGDTIASMLGFFLTWLVFGERPVSLPVVAVASFVIPEKPS